MMRIWMSARRSILAFGALLSLIGVIPGFAQVVDLTTAIVDSEDPVDEGAYITYTVDVSNIGDTESNNNVELFVTLPSGLPASMTDYLAGDQTAAELIAAALASAEVSANIWDATNSWYFLGPDSLCEDFLFQVHNLGVVGGVTGALSYDLTMPSLPTTDGRVHISSDIHEFDLDFGRGECDINFDCSVHPCMGTRISLTDPIEAILELVDDGTGGEGSLGCNELVQFTPGRIALIDRGLCPFEEKAHNAYVAGATGVIMADNDDFSDTTVDPDDIMNMSCVNYCDEAAIPIPIVFVSWTNTQILQEEMAGGEVHVRMGKGDTGGVLTTQAHIREDTSAVAALETNLGNNTATEITQVGYLFKDGFENASTDNWSETSP